MEQVFRFIIGGAVVSLFAVTGDVLKPKSFAGLFGAAPSVAVATLGLAIITHGTAYAAIEGRSMIAGAIGFMIYALACMWIMAKHNAAALYVSSATLPIWFACAFAGYFLILR